MKKLLLFVTLFALATSVLFAQRDTIVAWNFQTGIDSVDIYPNVGLISNANRFISAEDTTDSPNTIIRDVYMTNGAGGSGDYAATTTEWDNGANSKLWAIKFKAEGYESLQVSSKQRSGGNNPGPKYWKIQYHFSGEDWTDVENGDVICANDWNTGILDAIDLPSELNDPGSTSIYLRWIMTSDSSVNNTIVNPEGTSKIDDVLITGIPIQIIPGDIGDTIAAWTFPTGVDTLDIYPNAGLPENHYSISAEDTTDSPNTVIRDISFTNGVESFAATTEGWDDGANAKLWSIKFKAEGFTNLKISSKQRSGGNNPGPRDWKLQCRFSGEDWMDIPGGIISCDNDWTTGVVDTLPLPAAFNNPGSTSIYIRWIMTSNANISGEPVSPEGVSKIDNVVISGTTAAGVENIIYLDDLNIYPNPAKEFVNIESLKQLLSIVVYNTQGQIVKQVQGHYAEKERIITSDLESGTYIIHTMISGYDKPHVTKLIIR